MITLNQLRVFTVIAEQGGITAAAKKLFMTQPAVSIQLKQLENYYEIALVEIIGKKVYLTHAGQSLYQTAKAIMQSLDNIKSEFAELNGGLTGRLNIAVVSTGAYFLTDYLGEFHKKYPTVEPQLKVANRQLILERLKNNEDDLVILSQLPEDVDVISYPILHDQLVMIAANTHPLTKEKNIMLTQLQNEPFLIREKGSGTRMAMEKFFKDNLINPLITMELGSNTAIKKAVSANFGLSIVSKASIEDELALKKLSILDINKFPIKHNWYAVHLKGKILSPVAQNFLSFFRAVNF